MARLAGVVMFLCGLAKISTATAAAAAPSLAANGLVTCHIDPARVEIFYTDQHGRRFGSMANLAAWLAQSGRRIDCATNGGIFATDHRPLGWLITDGVELAPLNRQRDQPGNFFLQPNGALVIAGGKARILSTADIAATAANANAAAASIELAMQSGPLLMTNGDISSQLDPASVSVFSRNGVCVDGDGRVLLAYSQEMISLYQFAVRMRELGCTDALYLDGHLSQMYPSDGASIPAQREELSAIIGTTSRIENE